MTTTLTKSTAKASGYHIRATGCLRQVVIRPTQAVNRHGQLVVMQKRSPEKWPQRQRKIWLINQIILSFVNGWYIHPLEQELGFNLVY